MEDAVRPDEDTFKAMYRRGYRTWFNLYEMTVADTGNQTPWSDCLSQLETVFPNYLSFPSDLAVDKSFANTVITRGTSTWKTANGNCDLPSFDQKFFIQVASDRPTILAISDKQQSPNLFSPCSDEDDDHITLLILAWTYILSARWAEIIPGASGPEYTTCEADWVDTPAYFIENIPTTPTTTTIDLGNTDDSAARWWAAVLAVGGGWKASIANDKGHFLHSPWYTKFVSEQRFTVSRRTKARPVSAQYQPASFLTSLGYISNHCELHKVAEQSQAALAAALLLPIARYDNRRVLLPYPRVQRKVRLNKNKRFDATMWSKQVDQLDRLLTLSCNTVGTKALLTSVFFEPGVECNICGAWLQGTFAFLDSNIVQDKHILLSLLTKRDPNLGFLWLGAFMTGAQTRCFQEGRQAWWKIDLHAAAWTGTLMSFIQEPVLALSPGTEDISRADECRLLYLSHGLYYTTPPLFPFAPFGSIALSDTNIEVRQHARCDTSHTLEYKSVIWHCRGSQSAATTTQDIPLRSKNGHPTDTAISIPYDKLDNEDDDLFGNGDQEHFHLATR